MPFPPLPPPSTPHPGDDLVFFLCRPAGPLSPHIGFAKQGFHSWLQEDREVIWSPLSSTHSPIRPLTTPAQHRPAGMGRAEEMEDRGEAIPAQGPAPWRVPSRGDGLGYHAQ